MMGALFFIEVDDVPGLCLWVAPRMLESVGRPFRGTLEGEAGLLNERGHLGASA